MSAARACLLLLFACACDVYGPSLVTSAEGGADATLEACATTCGSTCVDLQNDIDNCGACGTKCETGCASGLCTPTTLIGGLGAPHGIFLHDTSLYVANHGSINVEVMSKIDGTGLKNFGTSQLFPDRLAGDANNLYWTDDANVSSLPGGTVEYGNFDGTTDCAISGDAAYTVCYDAEYLPSPYGIAVQGANMFMTTLDAANNGPAECAGLYTNSVVQCSTFGCAVDCGQPNGPKVLATGTKLASITADATNIYWADTGAHAIKYCAQPACAGGALIFADNLDAPFDVVSDGTTVLFTDRGKGTLASCPTTGCGNGPTVLASSLTDPLLVAFDSKNAYVTSYSAGTISSCDMPACAKGPKLIAKGLKAPYGIAIDSSYVYWSEEGSGGVASQDGSVSKLAR